MAGKPSKASKARTCLPDDVGQKRGGVDERGMGNLGALRCYLATPWHEMQNLRFYPNPTKPESVFPRDGPGGLSAPFSVRHVTAEGPARHGSGSPLKPRMGVCSSLLLVFVKEENWKQKYVCV